MELEVDLNLMAQNKYFICSLIKSWLKEIIGSSMIFSSIKNHNLFSETT